MYIASVNISPLALILPEAVTGPLRSIFVAPCLPITIGTTAELPISKLLPL